MTATLNTTVIQNASSSTANITLDTAGNVTGGANLVATGMPYGSSSFLRNRIINGNMAVAQRATNAALPVNNSSTYTTLDRFCSFCATGQTGTSSQVAAGLTGFQYALKLQRTAANTATGNIDTGQAVETLNSVDLAGGSVTFSFYAKAGANFSASGSAIIIQLATGTGTDQSFSSMTGSGWTGQSNIINFVSQAITTTWARYSFTATVASTATQIGFQIIYTPTGTAGADDSLYITGVQLEQGSVATPFERPLYSKQLADCQRYYRKTTGSTNTEPTLYAYGTSAQVVGSSWVFPVPMRTAPTATTTGTLSFGNASTPVITAEANSYALYVTCTSGTAITVSFNPNNSYQIGFSAEL